MVFEEVLRVEGEAQQSKGSYIVTMECSENLVKKKKKNLFTPNSASFWTLPIHFAL